MTKTKDITKNADGNGASWYTKSKAVREANLAKSRVGYREEIQPCGKGGKDRRKIRVAVYDYRGERGTVREIADRLGMSAASVYGKIATDSPLVKTTRNPTFYDFGGRKMTAFQIAREVCGKGCDRQTFKRTVARIYAGHLDPEELKAGRDIGYVYRFVDLDGTTKSATTTEICRYYAKYHDIEFTQTTYYRAKARLVRFFSDGKTFKIADLFNDDRYHHKGGRPIGGENA